MNPLSGPTLVIVEYRVKCDRDPAFNEVIQSIGTVRRRNGAFQWGLFIDTADPGKYIEEFMVESWAEHLRQHERLTISDDRVQQLLIPLLDEPPRISHFISAPAQSGNSSRPIPAISDRATA